MTFLAPLSGADYFMTAVDRLIRRSSAKGNVCHLVFDLQNEQFDSEAVAESIRRAPLVLMLKDVRLVKSFFTTGFWKKHSPAPRHRDSIVIVLKEQFKESDLAAIDLNPNIQPSIQFRVYPDHKVVFSWHHSVLDAHGAEIFCRDMHSSDLVVKKDTILEDTALRERFKSSRKLVRHIFLQARDVQASIKAHSILSPTKYLHHHCSLEEHNQISAAASNHRADLFVSLYVLACLTRAYREEFTVSDSRPLFIPVPHDRRRRGDDSLKIGNQLSFLYFRDLGHTSIQMSFRNLVDQMHTSIAANHHNANMHFMSLARRLPMKAYLELLLKPGGGQLGSLFFSDIGSSSDAISELGGAKVVTATHFPPNLAPPGFTCVTGMSRGRRFLTIVHDERYVSSNQAHGVMSRWREALIQVSEKNEADTACA